MVDQLRSLNPLPDEPKDANVIRVDEMELLLLDSSAEDLKETWSDIVGICKRANDQDAYQKLEKVKNRRKKELGI
jgi:hypothetical protein